MTVFRYSFTVSSVSSNIRHQDRQAGFTLIELLLAIGIISTLSGVVVVAVNPSAQLMKAKDTRRDANARELENAMNQYIINFEVFPGDKDIPEGKSAALSICRSGVTAVGCVNMDVLVPNYLVALPVDSAETSDDYTGYATYQINGNPKVLSLHKGGNTAMANLGWASSNTIRIPKENITASLTNFPLLLSFTDNRWKSKANGGYVGTSTGEDIVFTLEDETVLNHEVELYDPVSGYLIAWIDIPVLSSDDDTIFTMHYGADSSFSGISSAAVWQDYAGTWHLHQVPDTDGATQEILDSSSGSPGSSVNMNAGNVIGGIMGNGLSFQRTNTEYITMGDSDELDMGTDDFSLSAWMKGDGLVLMKRNGNCRGGGDSQGNGYCVYADNGGQLMNLANDPYILTSSVVNNYSDGQWHHMVFTVDRSGNSVTIRHYKDSILVTQNNGTVVGSVDVSGAFGIANTANNSNTWGFNGSLDEVRVRNSIVSDDWVAAEYANQNSPSTFVLVE